MTRALALLVVPLVAAALILPAVADAQRRGGRAAPSDGESNAPTPTLADLDQIVPRLESANPDEVREAIDLLSVIDNPRVIPPLSELLRAGQPDPIADRALEALRGLAHPSAIEVLTEFTRHRRAGARRRAYLALAAIGGRRIPDLIEQGLRDPDRGVRGACALALGDLGAKDSLDVLFQAFEAGVVEAAIAVGKLGDKRSVERYTEHLGKRPLGIMLSGYRHFVRRNDIPASTKKEIVTQLGEVSGPMVRRFLEEYLETFESRRRKKSELQEHVETVLRRIPSEGGVS